MGTDIGGWIEVARVRTYPGAPTSTQWYAAIHLDNLVQRNYDMFGCLFGVANFANFRPVVPLRGLPQDISKEAGDDFLMCETFAQTWITWQEIQTIDWGEDALDGRPRRYEKEEDGRLVYRDKASCDLPNGVALAEGVTWERDGSVFRVERLTRREVLSKAKEWRLLFDLMARLAQDFGDERVRLTAWFDR